MMQSAEHIYTPSELNREIKLHLEAGFPRVVIEAEISNLARPASGHLYFSLKDERAQIRCAMFRSAAGRMNIRPENGAKIIARGRISLYEPRGDYQFIVDSMQDAGEGMLQRQFEELKRKLDAEGLFAPELKHKLPPYPGRIGIITSPSGAAVRDLLHVLQRRWPVAAVRLYPVRVQGAEAPAEIRAAVEAANLQPWADLLIVGRGGGSLEDLAAFNDEALARSVAASKIPVISAVGHETDFSICDFVADVRAPTPSAAAELAVPDQAGLKQAFDRGGRQLSLRMQGRLQRNSQQLDHLSHRMQQRHPATRLAEQGRQLADLEKRLNRNMTARIGQSGILLENTGRRLQAHRPDRKLAQLEERVQRLSRAMQLQAGRLVESNREKLANLARTLHAVSPLETLGRGYAVVTDSTSGAVVSSVSGVEPGDGVTAQLSDGLLDCTVTGKREP